MQINHKENGCCRFTAKKKNKIKLNDGKKVFIKENIKYEKLYSNTEEEILSS